MGSRAIILIVDDEPEVTDFISEFLEQKGYGVITASNGREAVRAVREQRPSLVLLDIRMPEMDGLEALRRIRHIDPQVGVLILTGIGDASTASEAMRETAWDYVTKPIDFDYLELAIATKLAAR